MDGTIIRPQLWDNQAPLYPSFLRLTTTRAASVTSETLSQRPTAPVRLRESLESTRCEKSSTCLLRPSTTMKQLYHHTCIISRPRTSCPRGRPPRMSGPQCRSHRVIHSLTIPMRLKPFRISSTTKTTLTSPNSSLWNSAFSRTAAR